MALGKRTPKQPALWLATTDLPPAPGHPFYQKLNQLLEEAGFDPFVEDLCRPFYADGVGRPGIPPGVYFRMLFVGYFEGLDSQRGIAWRCADSRSLQAFLGYLPDDPTPDHSSLTKVRQRLPEVVHEEVFAFVLRLADAKGLLQGQTVAVDATTLEANAALKGIRRRDTGDDWKAYLRRLAAEAGIDNPTDEGLRRFDKGRKGKKVSNAEWASPSDPDSRIAKMKDGTTHLAYKAEHVVDLGSNMVLAAEVYPADRADSATLLDSLRSAQLNLIRAGSATDIEEAVADKGYHKAEALADCAGDGLRTYIPEPRPDQERVWADKPRGWERAYRGNRRRVRGARSKRLQRRRSEYVERTFAHVCQTGGARRSWLRGLANVSKRYLMQVAGHNLGILMRKLFGVGTPRGLQGPCAALLAWVAAWWGGLAGSARRPPPTPARARLRLLLFPHHRSYTLVP
ncbi:MAG TPA: transposase [Gemmataceae bacterium]|nr:transposase [Gemmataceae bacterium]